MPGGSLRVDDDPFASLLGGDPFEAALQDADRDCRWLLSSPRGRRAEAKYDDDDATCGSSTLGEATPRHTTRPAWGTGIRAGGREPLMLPLVAPMAGHLFSPAQHSEGRTARDPPLLQRHHVPT